MTRSTLIVILLLAATALGVSVVGPVLQLAAMDESQFPAVANVPTGSLIFGTDAGSVYVDNGTAWTAVGAGAPSYWLDGGGGYQWTPTQIRAPDGGPGFIVAQSARWTVASNANAIELSNNGRLDFGSGASDYLYGDNAGIETQSYIESMRPPPTSTGGGYGFAAYSYKWFTNTATSYDVNDFSAATYSGLEMSVVSPSNGATRHLLTNGVQGFGPNGTYAQMTRQIGGFAHPVEMRGHTLTMSMGIETTGCPTVRERIASNGTDLYEGACEGTTGTTTVTAGNYMREMSFTTAATTSAAAGWSSSDTSGGFRPFTRLDLLPRFCARVRPSITSPVTVRVGLCSNTTCATGVYWEYNSTVAANWRYCASGSCTSYTSLTVNTNPATLCVDTVGALGNGVEFWLNGYYAAERWTGLPSASTPLGPVVRVITGDNAAKTMTIQAAHVESF